MKHDKPDATTREVVSALRGAHASVTYIRGRQGEPDLLVGRDGRTELIEVVGPDKVKRFPPHGLQPKQEAWHRAWCGKKPHVVSSVDEALAVIGVTLAKV